MSTEAIQIPNIFSFAPSELTQDAFICWLAHWAHKDLKAVDKKLHHAGVSFINNMLNKHEVRLKSDEFTPEVIKQHHNIDVLIELDEHALLIEDKVFTRQHSEQLERYKAQLEEEYRENDKQKTILPIYFQTGSQSNYDPVKKQGYKLFLRNDFLAVLEEGISNGIRHDVFTGFYHHLKKIDDRFKSFKEKTVKNWDWEGWKGFFAMLNGEFEDAGWNYVANPSGGFMGFWWHFIERDDCTIYLQLENDKLCFKISVNKKESYSKLRNQWHRKIVETSKEHDLPVKKPARFGHGKQMTVAVLDSDYRETDKDDKLDLDKTIRILNEAVAILDEAHFST